jgi:aminoglycoside phosphotransferase (APT) family kinase protein
MMGRGRLARPDPARAAEPAAPRLDWRFLLADPELERVGVLGRRREGLLASLRALSSSVAALDSGPAAAATETFELVVACEPSASELDVAAARVASGGALVVETRGPLHLQTSRGVARRLARLGFEDVRSYWHWPSFERCTRIIPLEDRAVIRYGLSRGGQGIGARIAAWLGRGMLWTGLLRWGIACATVVGTRPRPRMSPAPSSRAAATRDGLGPGTSAILAFLHQHRERLGLDRHSSSRRLSFVVLTPRFRNSSHLIFLVVPAGGSEPVLVAKVARLPAPSSKSEGEAQRLRAIQSCAPGGFPSIPRLVAFEALGSHPMLLETALRGRAMDRSTVRADAPRCCEAALAWLIEVQGATRMAAGRAPGEIERLLEADLQRAEALLPGERKLIERTRQVVAPLARASLPLVLEHGDLSHPNLLVDAQGGLGVLDWEMAELRGLPATDLFFFLGYVAIARQQARTAAQICEVLDRAFWGGDRWARAYVGRYAEALGLPAAALTPLFVACWMRQVTGLAQRLGEVGTEPRDAHAGIGERVRRDWRFAAWQRAMDRADRLEWLA